MQQFILTSLTILMVSYCFAQEQAEPDKIQGPKKYGSVQLSAGTMHVYRTISLGYESPTLLQLGTKHQFRLSLNGGLWHARLYNPAVGSQFNTKLTYLFGEKAHKLEVGAGFTGHFIKGLKGQSFAYLAVLPNSFLGYRYEKPNGRLFFKAGFGWYEAVQLGIGLRF